MEAHSHSHQKANDCCGSACSVSPGAVLSRAHGAQQFRIASMDCSAEEAEIRRALEKIGGIRSLSLGSP